MAASPSNIVECDHTSVGMLVWRGDRLLLIERRRPPFGFAPPAGHVDGRSSFEEAAREELREEVGLKIIALELVAEGRKENPCRRIHGTWHYWKVYQADAVGDVVPSATETKRFRWCVHEELQRLAHRTEQYSARAITESAWVRQPGLEPVWRDWLTELKIL